MYNQGKVFDFTINVLKSVEMIFLLAFTFGKIISEDSIFDHV